ncbi:MAG: CPBP family intramembrane metalloprotease, partial [Acetatifactor sp.]|nr:CPBP family intramembrane metalloprotease [Acetatifactor sp.]
VHAPLVCFDLNYTGNYPGKPWSGILMMILFATSIGVFLSYLTLESGSIFPACIAHGAINAIREAPLFICLDSYNALLGPKPSGLIGMIGFLILGAAIFAKLTLYPERHKDS